MKEKKFKISDCTIVLLYIVFLILQILVIHNKVNYHVDETLSYGLANYTKGYFIALEEGHKYEPASDPFVEYLSCQPGNRSNFDIAWSNQSNDSHPPFYYALVHIACAYKVGTFSKWYAGAINIVFALLTLFMLRRLIGLLCDDKLIRNIISIGFVLTYGILNDVTLFRMYIMSMFLVILTVYLILLQLKKNMGIWFYLLMIITVYVGALSHYYCLLFDILISVIYCVYLLCHKKWKDVVFYCISMGIAAVMTICTFPPIVRHLFSTGHAKDAYAGLTSLSDYASRIVLCFNTINDMLFGKLLYLLIPTTVVLDIIKKKKDGSHSYLFVLLPAFLYFILIAITASYTDERYFTPIFALLYGGIFTLFLNGLSGVISNRKIFAAVAVVVVLCSIALSYYKAKWPYLYRRDLDYLNKADEHADADCICIHGEYRLGWEVQLNFNEFCRYRSFTLLSRGEIDSESIQKFIDSDQVVIHLTCIDDQESFIRQIVEASPKFSSYEVLGGNGCGVSYYLY